MKTEVEERAKAENMGVLHHSSLWENTQGHVAIGLDTLFYLNLTFNNNFWFLLHSGLAHLLMLSSLQIYKVSAFTISILQMRG